MNTGSLLAGHHAPVGEQKGLVLLAQKTQKVIFKTFTAGEVMPTHHHEAGDVFVVVLSGRLNITQEDATVETQAGDYVIFPAGARHSLACLEPARILIYR